MAYGFNPDADSKAKERQGQDVESHAEVKAQTMTDYFKNVSYSEWLYTSMVEHKAHLGNDEDKHR